MQVAPVSIQRAAQPTTRAKTPSAPANTDDWKNPAAAAALKVSSEMLEMVRKGIQENYDSANKVRSYGQSLMTTAGIFEDAMQALQTDASSVNDSFIPLIERASGNTNAAASRLLSKDLAQTWPDEREGLLEAVRGATVIASTVAEQLDPVPPRRSR